MQRGGGAWGHGALDGQRLALQLAEGDGVCARRQRATCRQVKDQQVLNIYFYLSAVSAVDSAHLPDIKVKPPGSTTPADVFSSVPLAVEDGGCQEGALVCTCRDAEDEEEEEELARLKAGLIRSCRDTTYLRGGATSAEPDI